VTFEHVCQETLAICGRGGDGWDWVQGIQPLRVLG
jgi:hypothetical protein